MIFKYYLTFFNKRYRIRREIESATTHKSTTPLCTLSFLRYGTCLNSDMCNTYILTLILKYFMFFFRKEQAEKKGKKLNHNDGAGGDEFLTVNLEKMLLMLNNVFTLPRSYRSMEGLRTAASDYISQKLGNLGLIVGIQYFFPSRFYHQVIYFY